jgi:DNA-binding transcriptional LysR family regulator
LSKQIHLLERQLGVRLFERDRRSVRLTAAGKALADSAETVLVAWEEALRACHDAAADAASVLVVGIQTSVVGVVLLAAGNARIYARPGIVCRPVDGLTPSQLAVARRRHDRRVPVRAFVEACTSIVAQRRA